MLLWCGFRYIVSHFVYIELLLRLLLILTVFCSVFASMWTRHNLECFMFCSFLTALQLLHNNPKLKQVSSYFQSYNFKTPISFKLLCTHILKNQKSLSQYVFCFSSFFVSVLQMFLFDYSFLSMIPSCHLLACMTKSSTHTSFALYPLLWLFIYI